MSEKCKACEQERVELVNDNGERWCSNCGTLYQGGHTLIPDVTHNLLQLIQTKNKKKHPKG